MRFCTFFMNLNKIANKKKGKTHRSISDESVQKRTSLNGNSMKMRDRPNTMTINPEKQIVKLSKLMRNHTSISTPTNGSTGNERHDVIKGKGLSV